MVRTVSWGVLQPVQSFAGGVVAEIGQRMLRQLVKVVWLAGGSVVVRGFLVD